MDGKITVSAKTLDEAITKALIELQTTSEHLQYEVVQRESSGLFGLFGGKSCIIRARVMSEEEERALEAARREEEKKKAAKEKAEKEAAARAEAERAAKAAEEKAAAARAAEEKAARA
ncbi:MAG: Jag N-terminal domain-containing protein, partial [Eubacteriales bacterium]|nr:Jag N-terminal domain-containing protein [Eubacteriales bacterium]